MASMVSRFPATLALLGVLLPSHLAAQDHLSLDQAISTALARNPSLQAVKAGARESEARVEEARAAYLPRVDYTEAWQRGDNPVFVFGSLLSQQRFTAANFALDALNHPDSLVNYHGALTVEQAVFDSQRLTGMSAADLGARLAQQGVAEARAELTLAVTRTYGGLLQTIAMGKAATAAADAARDDVARAEQRREVGLVSDADVLALRVHLAQMEERRIRAASGEAVARSQLNMLMGSPLDRDVVPEEPVPPPTTPGTAAADESAALRNRPAAQRADLQVSLAAVNRSAARLAFAPQVVLQGVYEINGHSFADRAGSWLVAGQVRVNLFAGLGDLARLRAATAAQAHAEHEREQLRASLRLDVRTARAELEGALAREAVGRAAVLQARESQRIVRDRYEAGLASVTDVLRAGTALLDAETARVASLVDVLVGTAALDRAVGRSQ